MSPTACVAAAGFDLVLRVRVRVQIQQPEGVSLPLGAGLPFPLPVCGLMQQRQPDVTRIADAVRIALP